MNKKISRKIKIGFPQHFCESHIPSNHKINIQEAKDFLNDSGLKVTKTRVDLLEIFVQNQNHNLTFAKILKFLNQKKNNVNVSSLYNNLKIFCRIGILRSNLNLLTHETTFELLLNAVPHIHAYIISSEKQLVFNIGCELHDAMIAQFEKENYIVEDYLIQAVIRSKPSNLNNDKDQKNNK
ncbi:Fur family transcriptional regulator protein [[Mycoplasma] cavipharyngis]|uniref:Fur family transcriptional regulator n=1 Tax=[Mycoplasma] cavipharyngis TaxID=92757 RepID=UPI003703FAF6